MPSTNPQVGRDASRRWRERNPEAVRKQKAEFYQRHKERLREQLRPGNVARSKALRRAALDVLGGVCVGCGFDDHRALQIDHINGGGGRERAIIKSRDAFNKKVIADQAGYQLLCANCNWIKRYVCGEHSR